MLHEDRRTGAGLLIYVPSHLPVKRRSDLEIEGVETIWLELQFPRSKSRLFCFVYRPPSANAAFTGLLEEMLSHSDCKNLFTVVRGDLKDGAYYCYCAYVLRISRYSDFLSPMLTNAGIFLRGLKLSGESRS